MTASTTTRATAPRLASDNLRSTVASAIALGISLAVSFVGGLVAALSFDADRADLTGGRAYVLVYFGFWIGYTVIHMALTWRVFHAADGETLRGWLQESTSARRKRRVREAFAGSSGPAGAIFFTVVAIAAVVVVAASPDLRRDPLVVGLAVAVVASSWLLLVTAYAVHYAREGTRTDQLRFPGGEPPVLADYVYLSVQVSTTFSTSDVEASGTAVRRAVSAHAVVAFAFNTVIVALLVSLLISTVG